MFSLRPAALIRSGSLRPAALLLAPAASVPAGLKVGQRPTQALDGTDEISLQGDHDQPRGIWLDGTTMWVTEEGTGNANVTITLSATTDSDAQGAVCTHGGKKLSEGLQLTVSGPGG